MLQRRTVCAIGADPRHRRRFEVRAGEILGMAGLVGAGRTELAEAVFGVRDVVAGQSAPRRPAAGGPDLPADAIAAGMLLVPEDRRLHGLVLAESVGFNLSLPNLDRLGSVLGVRRRAEAESAPNLDRPAPREDALGATTRRAALGRQPAESGLRQVARARAPGADPRRADARRGCRGEGRDLRA